VVTNSSALAAAKSFRLRLIAAFFHLLPVGTTFLAIRIAVEELPPLFAVARVSHSRTFSTPSCASKASSPHREQWRSLAIMGCSCCSSCTDCFSGRKNTCPRASPLCSRPPFHRYPDPRNADLPPAAFPLGRRVSTLVVFRQSAFLLRGQRPTYGLPCSPSAASLSWSLGAVITGRRLRKPAPHRRSP